MGQMQFITPPLEHLPPHAIEQAYLAGPEGIPWECRNTLTGNLLTVQRSARESGLLHFPWRLAGGNIITLSTATLMERARPYLLSLELARGTITRLRNQAALWEQSGMNIPAEFEQQLRETSMAFAQGATSQHDLPTADRQSQRAIELGVQAVHTLGSAYIKQVIDLRRQGSAKIPTLLGIALDSVPPAKTAAWRLQAAFNTVVVEPLWSELETNMGQRNWDSVDKVVQWAAEKSMRVAMGPIVRLDRRNLPDWITLWNDDFEELSSCVTQYVRAIVQRYKGKVQLWHAAAGLNSPDVLNLSEDQRLRLVVEVIEAIRNIDPRTPVIVSIDQPWGEYIAREDQELTPFSFADTLVRGELGIAGLGLEMNLGYWPHGTMPRDLLEMSRMLDRWSQLGLPLLAMISAASDEGSDPLARQAAVPLPGTTPASQQQLLAHLLPLLLAKHPVQGIIWNQAFDGRPHAYPHGGLFDAQGQPKPSLQTLADVRGEFLS